MEDSRGQQFDGAAGAVLASTADADREVREVSRQILIHLRDSYRGSLTEHDFEDLTQEALAELHRRRRHGHEVREPVAFAKKVAWRRARDLIRDNHSIPRDPRDDLFELRPDEAADFDRALAAKAELARAIEAAERLPADEQAVYRSHFFEGLKPRETCQALGVRRREYYLRLERATLAVQHSLAPHRYEANQRELLSAVIGGSASAAEMRRAKRLVRNDPAAAALVRELRELHQGAAAVLPVPALEQLGETSVFERVAESFAWIRDRTPGADPATEQLISQASTSGAGRAAGVGGAGVFAKLGLTGGAKIAAGCLATGAITAACLVTGLVPGSGSRDTKTPDKPEAFERNPLPVTNPELVERPTSPSSTKPAAAGSARPVSDSEGDSVSPAIDPSTPATEQEFGVASAAPAASPAAAPGGSASSEDVQQEFGP